MIFKPLGQFFVVMGGRMRSVKEASKNALRVYFGHKLNLEFHGPKATCDTGV
jgi:hypothetical protein